MNFFTRVMFLVLTPEQFVEKSRCVDRGAVGGGVEVEAEVEVSTEPLIPCSPAVPSEHMANISCSLETKDLWDKFHELGTEMIITKSGRCDT